MKIGIITFHFANNFGAALQTYALSNTISRLYGHSVEIIDYRNCFISFTDFVRIFPITLNLKELVSGLTTFTKREQRRKKFVKFQKKYFSLSQKYTTLKSLRDNPPIYDVYICGSDQIWNPAVTGGLDPAYFLDFVKNEGKKISFAASFGVGVLKKMYWQEVNRCLMNLDDVSVREKEGVNLAEKITGRKVSQLIDPTFLLNKEEWEKMAKQPKIVGEYILVYVMQNNKKVYEYAKRIKDILGLKMVVISRYGYSLDFMDEVLIDVGPEEYLGLFKNAAFVCTNSFHGLVFSIIFEKDFYVVPSTRFNSRINNLMQVLKVNNYEELTKEVLKRPGYSRESVKNIILAEQKKAFGYLKKNMNE